MSTVTPPAGIGKIEEYLGPDARNLLDYTCKGIPKASLHVPGPAWVDQVHGGSDRPTPVLRSLQALLDHGRLIADGSPDEVLSAERIRAVYGVDPALVRR